MAGNFFGKDFFGKKMEEVKTNQRPNKAKKTVGTEVISSCGKKIDKGWFVIMNITIKESAFSDRLAKGQIDSFVTISKRFKERGETKKKEDGNTNKEEIILPKRN